MARHRLASDTKDPVEVCKSVAAQVVTSMYYFSPAAIGRQLIRVARAPALSVAVIAPLVFASAVSGEARRFVPPASASTAAPVTHVAVVSPAAANLSGPAVVAVAREPQSVKILTATTSAPPPAALVNSTTALGIPQMALAAYRNAAQKMAMSDTGCGISWNVLAGIGRIESGHANGGATDAHGTAVRPIYGPALDGTLPGNEIIVQKSAGSGATYARAMGPMQFLPGTWARYASDGDGDGVADPQNLYDSALAAARYLCSGNLNLRDPSQAMAAILRYNNSMPYARNVLGWASAYATGVIPVDLPPVSGPAPPLGDMHLENPEGLGPGLPLNIHGLPPTDPMAQQPLIDFGPPSPGNPQPPWSRQPPTAQDPANCTLICIGR
jgi:membrane-bound lytic murein transglycosylase B